MGDIPETRRRALHRFALVSVAIAAAMSIALGASSAGASSSIEGTWSFGGGKIVIQPAENGTYEGVVVVATTFAECVHPVGQHIWTGMTEQPDGSYFGQHQWYYAESGCKENPVHGPTAWRMFEEANGSKYLKVCFSRPGTSQPSIAANGETSDVTYSCVNSELIAPAPVTSSATPSSGLAGFIQKLLKPSATQCVSGRHFEIHLAEPHLDPFKTVRITLKHKVLKTVKRGGFIDATINLKGLPLGAFTIKISATTVLGTHLTGSRTYHTCARKPKRRKPAKLKVAR
jgi:hypothetical protein